MPRLKLFLDEMSGVPLQSIWTDVLPVQAQSAERLDYATQKPEALLDRIIRASSNEGDLVLDCFCGSGTAPAVAEKLGRRWIAGDLGRFAIHTTRKRLLGIENVRPFVVQNLGKYERQAWQAAEFGDQGLGTRDQEAGGGNLQSAIRNPLTASSSSTSTAPAPSPAPPGCTAPAAGAWCTSARWTPPSRPAT